MISSMRPERIGPYRLEEPLGAGGMGEVFRAYDERLERRVAVKVIRPAAAADPLLRERFRREARAVARLSHPSIVQIHDILEWEGGLAIVMELVQGSTLSELLRGGPLAVPRALQIGREVAEALGEAHAAGILHRDLKAENVLVTPTGHAKVLDFGLAKSLEPGEAGEESALSKVGFVLGTCRAMSPEQASGFELDPRSDLFSLGVLLYEALTGESPFLWRTPVETLTRVCTLRQPPAREKNPEVPEALSGFVDRLLEKDPDRRPASAREAADVLDGFATRPETMAVELQLPPTLPSVPVVRPASATGYTAARSVLRDRRRWGFAALLLAVLLGVGGIALLRGGQPAPVLVAVPRAEIGSKGDAENLPLVSSGVRIALLRTLASLEGVSPVPAEQTDPVSGSGVKVARAVAADEVLRARLDCFAGACQVSLDRLRGKDGAVLWARAFEVPADDFQRAASAVAAQVRSAYPERKARPGSPELEVRGQDYEAYLRLDRRFRTERGKVPLEDLLSGLAAVRQTSPRFLDAYLLEADVARARFFDSRDPADLERALELVRAARGLAPSEPRPLFTLFDVAMTGDRLAEAEAALAELERLEPGDARLLAQRAVLLERRGKGEEALAQMRTAARRNPSWSRLYELANMEIRQGDTEAARGHLEELLARSPDNFQGRAALAQLELLNGSPERAAALYRDLARDSPTVIPLSNLGLAEFLLGRYPQAAESFRRALELEPENPFNALNLADVTLLLGRAAEAQALYERVIALSTSDAAAGNWQLLTVRAQAQAHLGRATEAVTTVQRALQLAPNNPQAAYEASLVYALTGERTSALVNAGKALDLGMDPRWFTFPWFDTLRDSAPLKGLPGRPRAGRLKPTADSATAARSAAG